MILKIDNFQTIRNWTNSRFQFLRSYLKSQGKTKQNKAVRSFLYRYPFILSFE
jgi:hypothetical protein